MLSKVQQDKRELAFIRITALGEHTFIRSQITIDKLKRNRLKIGSKSM